jgi:hypothetical protein
VAREVFRWKTQKKVKSASVDLTPAERRMNAAGIITRMYRGCMPLAQPVDNPSTSRTCAGGGSGSFCPSAHPGRALPSVSRQSMREISFLKERKARRLAFVGFLQRARSDPRVDRGCGHRRGRRGRVSAVDVPLAVASPTFVCVRTRMCRASESLGLHRALYARRAIHELECAE